MYPWFMLTLRCHINYSGTAQPGRNETLSKARPIIIPQTWSTECLPKLVTLLTLYMGSVFFHFSSSSSFSCQLLCIVLAVSVSLCSPVVTHLSLCRSLVVRHSPFFPTSYHCFSVHSRTSLRFTLLGRIFLIISNTNYRKNKLHLNPNKY